MYVSLSVYEFLRQTNRYADGHTVIQPDSVGWMVHQSIGRFVNPPLVHQSIGRSFLWFVGWLMCTSVGSLIRWSVARLLGRCLANYLLPHKV